MDGDALFRWIVLASLVLNLSQSAYFRHKARRTDAIARRAETGALIAVRLLVTLPLLGTIVAYVLRPSWVAWAQVELPAAVRWVGAVLALGVVPFTCWVLRSIGSNISETVLVKASHDLVTDGPYRWIRHPLYTSGLMLLTGIALMTASAFIAGLVVVVAVLILLVVIPREEAALVGRFGDVYMAYQGRTGRILPLWSRR